MACHSSLQEWLLALLTLSTPHIVSPYFVSIRFFRNSPTYAVPSVPKQVHLAKMAEPMVLELNASSDWGWDSCECPFLLLFLARLHEACTIHNPEVVPLLDLCHMHSSMCQVKLLSFSIESDLNALLQCMSLNLGSSQSSGCKEPFPTPNNVDHYSSGISTCLS